MIDVHCHLEQKDFDKDRQQVIDLCRKELKALVTCCAHPRDFELTMKMVSDNKGFVFASAGIHPEYVKEISQPEKESFFDAIRKNKNNLVAIGETGLDYNWIKETEWREKQKQMFIEFINLAKELDLPLIIHSRDAMAETLEILEEQKAERALLHLFGDKNQLRRVIDNGWFISIGPLIKQSKLHKKIVRDCPIEQIMLETDSPWFGFGKRADPTCIKLVCEKIAEVKKIGFEEAWQKCGNNAKKFFIL